VATNAILERRGARTGLLTTAGFRDLLEIGRLRLARLYDLDFERAAPLVPRRWRLEVGERMSHAGAVIAPLDTTSAIVAIDRLLAEGVESIAVCFLHSYASASRRPSVAISIFSRVAAREPPPCLRSPSGLIRPVRLDT
jgi:N-methylhydantoinase A